MTFDITDGRNRYAPCPNCGATLGMGLITKSTGLAVQCAGSCNFRGPEITLTGVWSPEDDRRAFEAWNALPRPTPPAPLRRPRKPDGSWPDSWYGALFIHLTDGDAVIYGHSEWPSCSDWLVPGAEAETRTPDP